MLPRSMELLARIFPSTATNQWSALHRMRPSRADSSIIHAIWPAISGVKGVRANVICPGGVFDGQDPRFVERYCARTPLGRMAEPADLVGAFHFLASKAASYITGATIMVDGGWTAT